MEADLPESKSPPPGARRDGEGTGAAPPGPQKDIQGAGVSPPTTGGETPIAQNTPPELRRRAEVLTIGAKNNAELIQTGFVYQKSLFSRKENLCLHLHLPLHSPNTARVPALRPHRHWRARSAGDMNGNRSPQGLGYITLHPRRHQGRSQAPTHSPQPNHHGKARVSRRRDESPRLPERMHHPCDNRRHLQ